MKADIEKLISRLTNKSLCACGSQLDLVCYHCKKTYASHPILIGTLLRMFREHDYEWGSERKERALKLMALFQACGGEDKSLQSILAEAEWELAMLCAYRANFGVLCQGCDARQVPKDPNIRNLFQLLLDLNLAE